MRGRLINPFVLTIGQLDTAATAAVVGGGYDHDFNEPRLIDDGTQAGGDTRRETTLTVDAQIEPAQFNSARAVTSGQVREARFVCVVHFWELELRGLIDPTGQPMIRVNDRLVDIHDKGGLLVMSIPTPPGMYLRETLPIGFGLGGKRNLLQLEFRSREQAR